MVTGSKSPQDCSHLVVMNYIFTRPDDHDGDGVSWFVFVLFSQDHDVCVKNL